MDSSALFQRGRGRLLVARGLSSLALVAMGVALSSCASRSSEGVAPSPSIESEIAAAAQPIEPFAPQEFVSALTSRTLIEASDASPGIAFLSSDRFAKIVVTGDLSGEDYKISRYSNPDRIVVDLFSIPSRINRVFGSDSPEFITNVRLGAHPDKSRIVLDLNGETTPTFESRLTEGGLEIAVGREDAIASAFASEVSEGFASPRMEVFSEEIEVGALEQDATDSFEIDSEIATLEGETFSDPALNAVSVPSTTGSLEAGQIDSGITADLGISGATVSSPTVRGLSLEQISGGQNALIAHVTSAGAFTLTRTAPSEYVLAIEDASIAPEAATAVVAAPGAMPIRSVRPVTQGSNVLLRIFVTPESSLEARPVSAADGSGDTRLYVSSSANTALDEMRAQQAEPVAAEGEAVEADTTTAASPSVEGVGGEDSLEVLGLLSETPVWTGRLISLDLQDTDIDNALRIIAEVSNLNIIASDDVTGKVTLRLIDVPWDQALDVILKTNGLDKVQEGNVVRIAPVEKLRQERESLKQAKQAEEELEALQVKYVRISYGRAAELKPLVETVLSERGSVAYDERTNQLIVKDIRKGIKNVAELVAKVDLRTPQVLLETQIVEAKRGLLRDLGASFGYNYVRSPELGNATGYDFPNSVDFGAATNFLGPQDATMSLLFGSADGSQDLNLTLSAYEQEGRVRVVSRPAVATTNNKQAMIKSVEKIRVKLPGGGTSVATGQGASASGASTAATETIEIGIELEVTPQASPDYYVLLDLKAKSSTFGDKIVEGIPSEVERSANSTVLVSSGQTFAMGGIYKTNDFTTDTGVPFLKDLPVLGVLFRDIRVDNTDEELLFFITPRIIEGSFDDAAMKSSV